MALSYAISMRSTEVRNNFIYTMSVLLNIENPSPIRENIAIHGRIHLHI